MPSAVIRSVYSYPAMRLAPQQVHQRYVHPGPLVLGTDPLNIPTPTADRDRTVSRRSEPNSRTALNGEQPYPWDLLQPQDAMSRHRGAKQPRRYGLLGVISLLSPAYLLSVERWPFHRAPPLLFRRRPPQSNYPPYTVPDPDNGSRLDIHDDKGGISRVTPRRLAPALQSLPPILHMPTRMPV